MRQALSTHLLALLLCGWLSAFFVAPAAATSVDIIIEGHPWSPANVSGIAVTLYNLDTRRSHTGRTLGVAIVWPRVSLQAPGAMIGIWTISPIRIRNTQDCGQVFQTGSMALAEKIGPGHWRGTYSFRWDTSRADPACRFKFSKRGTATVDLYLDGASATIKYSNTGQNTFADDTLTRNGTVMTGQDATGQVVTYTRN